MWGICWVTLIIMINIMMMIIIMGDHLNKSLDGFPALITLLSTDENTVGALKILCVISIVIIACRHISLKWASFVIIT